MEPKVHQRFDQVKVPRGTQLGSPTAPVARKAAAALIPHMLSAFMAKDRVFKRG